MAFLVACSSQVADELTPPPLVTTTSSVSTTTTTTTTIASPTLEPTNDKFSDFRDRSEHAIQQQDLTEIERLIEEAWGLDVSSYAEFQELLAPLEWAEAEIHFSHLQVDQRGVEATDALLNELPTEFFVVDVHSRFVILGIDGVARANQIKAHAEDREFLSELPGAMSTPWGAQRPSPVDPEVPTIEACTPAYGTSEGWYMICDSASYTGETRPAVEIRFANATGIENLVAGPAAIYTTAEEEFVHGSWRSVVPNEEGVLLGQWSGECEVPSAHLYIEGTWWHPWFKGSETGPGELVFADEKDTEDWGWGQSSALGWLSTGQAAIGIAGGACSWDEAGLMLVDPDGSHEIIYPHGNATLWDRP